MVWREVLLPWACLLDTNIPDEENKKLSSPIWYDPRISTIKHFLPQWFNKGGKACIFLYLYHNSKRFMHCSSQKCVRSLISVIHSNENTKISLTYV